MVVDALTRFALLCLRAISRLPYPALRAFGNAAGSAVWWLAVPRRRVTRTNLRLCFPHWSENEREHVAKAHFRFFVRSFVDRFVFWYGPAERIRTLCRLEGLEHFDAHRGRPVILLAPHFVGCDAGGARMFFETPIVSMYAKQKNRVFDEAMTRGRTRFSGASMVLRTEGLRTAIRELRNGVPFYFLPDMDLGPRDALFVPFFGVRAATVTSVARLARLAGAVVVPCVTQMHDDGYVVRLYPAWDDFPGDDLRIATRRMNAFIEERVLEMPAQYLWSHRRFKTRPPGEPSPYASARGVAIGRERIGDNRPMKLRFTKMHGAGNDFVVIDGVRQAVHLEAAQWRRLADRHLGIGADQILLVEPASADGVDFRYRIFNADGGEVEQCGNGARCFARFVHDKGLTDRRSIRVETLGGIIEPSIEDDGRVRVDMGAPAFEASALPFDASGLEPRRAGEDVLWPLEIDGGVRWVSIVSMGNPHAVQIVDDIDSAPVRSEGPRIEVSPRFPRRVNAGYLQVVSPTHARLRVWERGAGETLACGTGACAAVVTGIRRGVLRSPVDVDTQGGRLSIGWQGGNVCMTGQAETVFEGEIDLARLPEMDPE